MDPRPFDEPWQAEAFAMVVALHERGVFTWAEWADTLSQEVKRPGAAADGSDYYQCWLRALERLLAAKGIAGSERYRRGWPPPGSAPRMPRRTASRSCWRTTREAVAVACLIIRA